MRNDPNYRLSMESNYRPQLGLFELKLLKIWAKFKHINSLLGKRHMIRIFSKNMSKIPVDNGSSLNKLITLQIIALTNITLIVIWISASYLEHIPMISMKCRPAYLSYIPHILSTYLWYLWSIGPYLYLLQHSTRNTKSFSTLFHRIRDLLTTLRIYLL
jgi:hypothetical protein